MRIEIPFGREKQAAEIPDANLVGVALPPATAGGPPDQAAILAAAFLSPIGRPRLQDLAEPGQRVAIIVSDHTRPTPTGRILPYMLGELDAAGVSRDSVTVVFATGMHRLTKPEEMERILGPELLRQVRCVTHDGNKDEDMRSLGETRRGTPILINKHVADADLRLSIGTIEPHQSAGWSGGAKNVMPGVSSKKSIMVHHSRRDERLIMLGDLDNNPFRDEIEEIAARLGVHFICNVILNRQREIIAAFAGDIVAAHRQGVEYARSLMAVSVDQPDIVIAGCGGFPRDADFWQVEGKLISRVYNAVRPGGILIMVADCSEGFGNQTYMEYLMQPPATVIHRYQTETYSVPCFKAYKVVRLLKDAQIFAVLAPAGREKLKCLPCRCFDSLAEAVAAAFAAFGSGARVLAVPDASSVLISTR